MGLPAADPKRFRLEHETRNVERDGRTCRMTSTKVYYSGSEVGDGSKIKAQEQTTVFGEDFSLYQLFLMVVDEMAG